MPTDAPTLIEIASGLQNPIADGAAYDRVLFHRWIILKPVDQAPYNALILDQDDNRVYLAEVLFGRWPN